MQFKAGVPDRRVSESRRTVDPFSQGGDDLRVVVVHVVMYVVAPVEGEPSLTH